jgi:hypothetical protein
MLRRLGGVWRAPSSSAQHHTHEGDEFPRIIAISDELGAPERHPGTPSAGSCRHRAAQTAAWSIAAEPGVGAISIARRERLDLGVSSVPYPSDRRT